MLRRISDRINRLRHRKGFGVHSPLAFRLVSEVIAERTGYAFYSYRKIPSPDGRRLLRIIAGLRPKEVIMLGDDRETRRIVSMAGNRRKMIGPSLSILSGEPDGNTLLATLSSLGEEDYLYCRGLNDSELQTFKRQLPGGILLTSRRYTLCLRRSAMPLQVYTL